MESVIESYGGEGNLEWVKNILTTVFIYIEIIGDFP